MTLEVGIALQTASESAASVMAAGMAPTTNAESRWATIFRGTDIVR